MNRMALATVTCIIAVVTVALVTAGCSGTPLETAAGSATARVAAANPCAAKATQPGTANPCAAKVKQPCAAQPCAAKVLSAAAKQPCAANPCAPQVKQVGAAQPCAANPCAAKNPCGAVQAGTAKPAVAKMIKGEIIAADPTKSLLSVRHEGQDLALQLDRLTSVRQGPTPKTLADLQAGQKATISYVERNGQQTAKYIYLAAATAANPCGANPCAAKNPCAPTANPCAAKGKNPCGANPCAPKR